MRSTRAVAATGARPAPGSAAVLRIAFGLVWVIDATFKWMPGFRHGFASTLDTAASGQPGWLHPWFGLWTGLSPAQATVMAYGTALTETAIALAVLCGFARVCTYSVAAGYSLILWASAEGFGGPYHAGSTDIGTGIIYSFVFVGLLVLTAHLGPDRYSADYWLERRVPWWWRVAEVRRPVPLRPVDLSVPPVSAADAAGLDLSHGASAFRSAPIDGGEGSGIPFRSARARTSPGSSHGGTG
jgi:nitrite reductase (NO-forming)